MRQFQVPQFITVEDRVFGPLTIKQFLYIAGGGLLIVGAKFVLLPLFFYPLALVIGALAASLAFLKINERPLPIVVKNALFFFIRPRLYIWRKESMRKPEPQPALKGPEVLIRTVPKMSESKLTDIAWSLDIKQTTRK